MPPRHRSFSSAGACPGARLGLLLTLALGRPNHLSTVLLGPGVYAFMNESTKMMILHLWCCWSHLWVPFHINDLKGLATTELLSVMTLGALYRI